MINYNGKIFEGNEPNLLNRGFLYGDCVFETIKVINNKIIFWEDHYLRLMSSLRVIRLEIPLNYTPEFFKLHIENTFSKISSNFSGRIRLSVYRSGGGLYSPNSMLPNFIINVKTDSNNLYEISEANYKVDLFKDYYMNNDLLSNLKTNNKIINVLAGIFAKENGLDNCILLNHEKNVVEFYNGNLFFVKNNNIKTPPLSSGCLKGIMRKKILSFSKLVPDISIIEENFSPFELLSGDEIWMTNTISGITPITNYRKKKFSNLLALRFLEIINNQIKN
ncbi:MAG: aminotransferase class IV [Flavobacteriaceae bacterium]|nr:aminotransferase class IV [Flavobacteriaceae bacterium]